MAHNYTFPDSFNPCFNGFMDKWDVHTQQIFDVSLFQPLF